MSDAEVSCSTCIFFREDDTINGPACSKGKGPLFIPLFDKKKNEEFRTRKASSCDTYEHSIGDYRSDGGANVTGYTAFIPSMNAVDSASYEAENPDKVNRNIRSCLQCKYYVAQDKMMNEGLWPVGACSARGILVDPKDTVVVGSNCSTRAIGIRDSNAFGEMQLAPEYTMSTIGKLSTVSDFVRDAEVRYVEPQDYETDAPVSDAEKSKGIRAWRKIESQDKSIHLPIFDPAFFSEEERSAIPMTGDDEHPEEYVDHLNLVYKTAVLWMALDETPALWGVAGTGKTEFFRHMAWIMSLPFQRISVTGSTEVDDLAGKMHFDPDKGTYFEYGRIPAAWTKPGIICLDEPNVGQPDVWQFIRPLTDNSKQLVLDMNKGERIARHDHAFLGMAMNPAWDVRNSGTESLADADGSRLMHIFVDLPSPEVEKKIIFNRVKLDGWELEGEQLDMIMGIAEDLRSLSQNETIPITWGIRPQIKVARALKWFPVSEAYRLATADYLEPEHQEAILDVVKTHTVTAKKKKEEPSNHFHVTSTGKFDESAIYVDRTDPAHVRRSYGKPPPYRGTSTL